MDIHGNHLIAGHQVSSNGEAYQAINPSTGQAFGTSFREAESKHVDQAMKAAEASFDALRGASAEQRAVLLESIADEVLAIGDALLERTHAETGLPMGRLTGERGRAVNQMRLFADVIREGSWVNARIDKADPDRQPFPKPDVRTMLQPVGPIAVFGASNFPLAIGVAGTDTVAALGAGCPVVVKAHPAHPGTSELLSEAINKALAKCGLPAGAYSMLHGRGHEVGLALVRHAATKAVAFTGGLKGGRALFDAAAARPHPIPVYAEMGSTNPIFLLPGALKERGTDIAKGYLQSVNLGVGQFCTNPGVVLGLKGALLDKFTAESGAIAAETDPATMLHPGISSAFNNGVARIRNTEGVMVVGETAAAVDRNRTQASCTIFSTDIQTLRQQSHLMEEVFGPASIIVSCEAEADLESVANDLDGHLSATVHGTEEDLRDHAGLIRILEKKVGRIIFNGFPTGIEVCEAMHHGGPYPATTDAHYTSIGTAAILRFARPVCYQGFPDEALPAELRNENIRGIWRTVDRKRTQA